MRPRRDREPTAGEGHVLSARWTFDGLGGWFEGGGVLVRRGRVLRLLPNPGAVRRALRAGARVLAEPGSLLTPGLVVAHSHLELAALAGRVDPGQNFVDWLGNLVRERAATDRETLALARAEAARALLAGGVTTVADVDSTDLWREPLGPSKPRLVVQRELLDLGRSERREAALARVARRLPPSDFRREALAPHAPYSTSEPLLLRARALAERRGIPIALHWAETEEEEAYLAGFPSPWERLFGPVQGEGSGLERFARAGLLGSRTALVHGNAPRPGEREAVARTGATLVHCPGAHRFFGRPPFDLAAWLRAGVPVALGTDSAAGNGAIDLLREARLLLLDQPFLDPRRALEMVTGIAARAAGLEGEAGCFRPGAFADGALWDLEGTALLAMAEGLFGSGSAPRAVWVGGRRAIPQRASRD